jgi:hypothetical protein
MTQGNILEQAKQGNPNAIAALMSRSMKSQGIDVKASLDNDRCLDVILEAEKVPTPQATVAFIRKGMTNLGVKSIDIVRVSAYQAGESIPAWQEELILQEPSFSPPPPPVPSPQLGLDDEDAPIEDEDLLPEDLLDDELSSQEYDSRPNQDFYDQDYGGDLLDDVTEFTPDDEYSASDYGSEDEEPMDDEHDMADAESQSKKRSLAIPLLLLLLAALGIGGFYLYSQKPELLASIPVLKDYLPPSSSPETSTATAPETSPQAVQPTETKPAPTPAPSAGTPKAELSTPAAPTGNPFSEAVRKATSASQLAQTAASPEDWGQVAADWQAAIALMQAVPKSNPQYAVAQQRVPLYQKNLQYAQQKAGQ